MRPILAVIAAFALTAAGLTALAGSPASADTTPTATVIAGNGASGFGGDEGPATNAQLGQINGLAVDASGNVDYLDGINRRIRQIDDNGTITTIQGDGSYCGDIGDINQPTPGMCPLLGLAVSSEGTLYYGDNGGISRANGGIAYHYAGQYSGFNAQYGDGPKYNVRVNPGNVVIDPISNNVTFNNAGAVQQVADDNVNTILGSIGNCSPVVPASGQTGLGTCYGVGDLAYLADSLYFTDTDASGNSYVCVMKDGVVTVLAGNGSFNDNPTDGPALGTGLPQIRAIAVAPDGTVFVAGPSRGRIWEITPDGTWQFVYELAGGIPFMVTDNQGSLFVASNDPLYEITKLTGVTGPPEGTSPTPTPTTITPTPSPTTSVPPPPGPTQWVALGDSYSSGEGNPPFIKGTDVKNDKCHRSMAAYSEVAAAGNPRYHLSFHACSGAVLADMYHPNIKNTGETHPQLDWVNGNTGIVTLTIGGNDAQFAAVMGYCAKRTSIQKSCQKKWQGVINPIISGLPARYSQLLTAIHLAAPHAQIYLLGYPRFFPIAPPKSCATGVAGFSFTASDMQWINAEISKVDQAEAASASTSRNTTYVNTYNMVGSNHDLCSKQPWLNRAVPSNRSYSYHPNLLGQQREAEILTNLL